MGPSLLIGLVAGAASALLAAGVATGSALAVPLFYLAPLPVIIAGVAFSPVAALVAAVTASLALGYALGASFLSAYGLGMGGPGLGLSYMALLAQPRPDGREGLVWFPVGGLVLAAAGFGSVSVVIALLTMAGDYEAYRAAVTAAFESLVTSQGDVPNPVPVQGDSAAIGAMLAHVLPPMAGLLGMVSLVACLYLAGKAAAVSERLARPWPDLAATRLPGWAALVWAGALAASFLPAFVGLSASVVAATVGFAFALAGFALVHQVTRGNAMRVFVLTGLWSAAVLLGWPLLFLALLGLADALTDIRSRLGNGAAPPAANDR